MSGDIPFDDDGIIDAGEAVNLDRVDRGILFALQRDARNITIDTISEQVEVSPSTVRNRIEKMERRGVIEGYAPSINYEKGGFPLHVLFVCSVDTDARSSIASDLLEIGGVVHITEMLTSEENLYVEVVATNTADLARITSRLGDSGVRLHSSEIITRDHKQPWGYFEYDGDE